MSAKANAPNRRVAAIQAKKKRKQPKKSKTVGEGGAGNNKERDRARETRAEVDRNRSFEEVSHDHQEVRRLCLCCWNVQFVSFHFLHYFHHKMCWYVCH